MSTKADIIKLRVFLEGVLLKDVTSVQVTSTNGPEVDATLVIPDTRFLYAEKIPRARLHIFWSNLKIREAHDDPDGSKGTWPVFFEGELWGDEKYKTIAERNISIRFKGYAEYWKQNLLFYMDPSSTPFGALVSGGKYKLALGTETKIDLNFPASEKNAAPASLLAELVKKAKPEKVPFLLIARIMQRALETNKYYKEMNSRLKLGSRTIGVEDAEVGELLKMQTVVSALDQHLGQGGFSGRTPILAVFEAYFRYVRYRLLSIPSPIFAGKESPLAEELLEAREDINRLHTEAKEAMEVAASSRGQTISRGESSSLEKLDFGENTGFLGQFLVLPETAFMQPPTCNVIYPSSQTSLGFSRNFMDEPTRLVATTDFMVGGGVPLVYMTPPTAQEISSGKSLVGGVSRVRVLPGTTTQTDNERGNIIFSSPLGGPISGIWVGSGFGQERGDRFHNGWDIHAPLYDPIYSIAAGTIVSIHKEDPVPGSPISRIGECGHPIDGPAEKWKSPPKNPAGNYVLIRHDIERNKPLRLERSNRAVSAIHAWYFHLSGIHKDALRIGHQVRAGQVIGWSGNSGRSTGAHLHFQLTFAENDNEFINPTILFPGARLGTNNKPPEVLETLIRGADPNDANDVQRSINESRLSQVATPSRSTPAEAEDISANARLQDLFTPEERRRGINAAFLDINDIGLVNALHTKIRDNLDTEDETTQQSSIDERDTFMLGFTEHLFLLSKYATRQIPTLVSPFNPFVVAGFPALIIDPIRSILGQVEMVSHNIDNRGNATTSIQLSSPRFWDEGDIWYWLGGWRGTDDFIRFPPWYNRKFIATNNIILDSERRLTSRFDSLLDITYQGLLGCKGIRYRSINADRIDSPLLDPATGAVIDYNAAIDGRKINEKGEKGEREAFTLVSQQYGQSEIQHLEDADQTSDRTQRFGAREKELMVEFLGAEKTIEKGVEVYRGDAFTNTFESDEKRRGFYQNHILDYVVDLIGKTARRG